MPRSLPYLRASGEPANLPPAFMLRRLLLLPLFIIATVAVIYVIAGDQAPAVFQTWVSAVFLLPILVAALMLGIALTHPLAKRHLFDNSPYPNLFRLILALALGLGALALGMLLFGTLHLIEPGHTRPSATSLLPIGGYPWIPAVLLFIAAGIGFLPSREFLRTFDRRPFKKRIHRAEWLILLAAVPVAVMCIAATFPPGTLWNSEGHGYDVLEYHLELPREYAANNSTAPVPHNMYSVFPQNVEMLYLLTTQLSKFAMGDSLGPASPTGYLWGIYPSQFLHVFLMLLTAGAIGLTPIRLKASARFLAVVLFLSIPWTIITGSLAYNEAGMLLFGSLAFSFALLPRQPRLNAILIGILLGLAMGCKLTAAPFFALPIGILYLLRAFQKPAAATASEPPIPQFKPILALIIIVIAAAVAYSPWAIRAAVYSSGNPVFPLATSILPRNHWTLDQSQRFIRGHSAQQNHEVISIFNVPARAAALFRESAMSAQWSVRWASINDWTNEPSGPSAWKQIGILWIIAPIALVLAFLAALRRKEALPQTLALFLFLLIQVLAWMFLTHLQSRFLLPIAIPLVLLIAAGAQGLGDSVGGLSVGVLKILITAAIAVQALCCSFLLLPEADLFHGTVARSASATRTASFRQQPIGKLFEFQINLAARIEDPNATLPIDQRPVAKILLLGDATPLFYEGFIVYNTVFDKNPFAEVLETKGPAAAVQWLRDQHIRYVLINWTEIDRLRTSYLDHNPITPESIAPLMQYGLKPLPLPDLPASKSLFEVLPPGKT